MWTFPRYNLDQLQARARARLLAMGENPRDRLKVYALVAVLRAEELRESRFHEPGERVTAAVKREVPVAKSARIDDTGTTRTRQGD